MKSTKYTNNQKYTRFFIRNIIFIILVFIFMIIYINYYRNK